eukprot:Colp12_sorted_trinity150504_noHs@16176
MLVLRRCFAATCIPSTRIVKPLCVPSLTLIQPLAPLVGRRSSLADRAAEFPDVIREWHPHKNPAGPECTKAFARSSYWFVCQEGHEWKARVCNRTLLGAGCPTCKLKKVTSTHNLLAKHPALTAEWHPTKNGELTPDAIAPSSNQRVWWQCQQGHEWEATAFSRSFQESGCPKCVKERQRGMPKGKRSLLTAHPDLAQQWHPTKNGVLTPDTVSRGSDKKVWWQCTKDRTHEWEARVSSRSVSKTGCPLCKAHVNDTNNLLFLYPKVAEEWHPTLNDKLVANMVASKSSKKVWWLCSKCGHEWQKVVNRRTIYGAGCPMCARQRRKVPTS